MANEKPEPKVGQILYSLNVGNAARRGVEQKLTPVVVMSVGRKYFTCGEGFNAKQYCLGSWQENTNFTATSCLYETEQEWADDKRRDELLSRLRNEFGTFGNSRMSLGQLERITAILEEQNHD